ncbi:hypothetical protein V865_000036 [Kwoniella europaea PYCC6329]|uniref:Histone acetyltransferase n=1 Tax=Kwoniella europaea PYCC6329 TaxID=1423913 RepID=A0AAX4K7X7_9TREE
MRTPTRSSSRALSVRSGLSRTPSKLPPASPTPKQQQNNDIPIDPALLQEEDDMEDAEGELVDEELEVDMINHNHRANGHQHQHQYHHHHQPDPIASSSSSYQDTIVYQPPVQAPAFTPRIDIFTSSNGSNTPSPRKRARVARSSTSLSQTFSTPQPNGEFHTHTASGSRSQPRPRTKAKPHGKGKGKQPAVFREPICSFCAGTDKINKLSRAERMVSCTLCGRSGHPSCLNMEEGGLITVKIQSYDWQCIECKVCESCKVKGDDSRLMFCDTCDRGWHSYCLVPVLARPPKGLWHCPRCLSEEPSLSSTSSRSHKTQLNTTSSSSRKAVSALLDTQSISTPTARHKKTIAVNGLDDLSSPGPSNHTQRIKVKIPKASASVSASEKRRKIRERADAEDEEGTPMIVRLKLPNKNNHHRTEIEDTSNEPEEILEEEKVPYGGIITGKEADTSKTEINERDKEEFERSRKLAESKLGGPLPNLASSSILDLGSNFGSPGPSTPGTPGASHRTPIQTPNGLSRLNSSSASVSRPLRDRLLQQTISMSDPSPTSGYPFPPSTPPHGHLHHPPKEDTGKPEKINKIRFGQFDIDTWYSAPYPEEYVYVPDGRLWLCEFCLKYMKSGFVAGRHRLKCKVRHPPGDEIYRDGAVSVFEVDGRKNKIYCQNLCLLAKMFLDHKTLYYDVEPFLFYVMTEVDDLGARFVGYFSKEKRSLDNNVSCIMTLPVRQRKGWGQLLIDFSYLLSKKEGRVGSPEKPLSGLGAVTYKGYWRLAIFRYLLTAKPDVSMDEISLATSITLEDIYSVLTSEDMINVFDSRPSSQTPISSSQTPKSRNNGPNRSRKKPPANNEQDDKDIKVPLPTEYSISVDKEYIQAIVKKHDAKGYLVLKPERLKYHPFLVTRNPTLTSEERAEATLKIIGQSTNTNANLNGHGHERNDDVNGTSKMSDHPTTEEEILKGKDQATLNLVAELSQSPARSLRRKPRESPSVSVSPIKSLRSRTNLQVESPPNTRELRKHSTLPAPSSFDGSPSKSDSSELPVLKKSSSLNGINGNEPMSSRRRRIILSSDTEHEEEQEEEEEEEEVEQIEYDKVDPRLIAPKSNGDVPKEKMVYGEAGKNDEIVNGDEFMAGDEPDAEGEDEDAEGEDEDAEGEDDDEYIG